MWFQIFKTNVAWSCPHPRQIPKTVWLTAEKLSKAEILHSSHPVWAFRRWDGEHMNSCNGQITFQSTLATVQILHAVVLIVNPWLDCPPMSLLCRRGEVAARLEQRGKGFQKRWDISIPSTFDAITLHAHWKSYLALCVITASPDRQKPCCTKEHISARQSSLQQPCWTHFHYWSAILWRSKLSSDQQSQISWVSFSKYFFVFKLQTSG